MVDIDGTASGNSFHGVAADAGKFDFTDACWMKTVIGTAVGADGVNAAGGDAQLAWGVGPEAGVGEAVFGVKS